MRTSGDPVATLNSLWTICVAAYLYGLSLLVMNVQPLLTGALLESDRIDASLVGATGALMLGSGFLTAISVPLWIRKVDWRKTTFVASVLATACLLAASFLAAGPAIYVALYALLGAVMGLLGAPAFAMLGDTADPVRSYAISVVVGSLLGALTATPISAIVIPAAGVDGAFQVLAAFTATGALMCVWLPARGRPPPTEAGPNPADVSLRASSRLPVGIALLALAAFNFGVMALWFFLERLGVSKGVDEVAIGLVLSICSLTAIVSSVLVAAIGRRATSFSYVLAGAGLCAIGYLSLFAPGQLIFSMSCVVFSLGAGVAGPGFMALIREIDTTNRLFVAVPAATSLGAIVGTSAAGPVIVQWGHAGLLIACVLSVTTATAMIVLAVTLHRRAIPKP